MTKASANAPATDTALLVVDMQLYFLDDRFGAGKSSTDYIVPAINRLAVAVRNAGGKVIWIYTDGEADMCSDWTPYAHRSGEKTWQKRLTNLSRNGPGYDLHAKLEKMPGDIDFVKTRYSAFLKAPKDMDDLLTSLGVSNVIVCGTRTDVCCESTVRDAMMMNYDVVIATDAMSADSTEIHDAAIRAMAPRFAEAKTVAEIEADLGTVAAAAE